MNSISRLKLAGFLVKRAYPAPARRLYEAVGDPYTEATRAASKATGTGAMVTSLGETAGKTTQLAANAVSRVAPVVTNAVSRVAPAAASAMETLPGALTTLGAGAGKLSGVAKIVGVPLGLAANVAGTAYMAASPEARQAAFQRNKAMMDSNYLANTGYIKGTLLRGLQYTNAPEQVTALGMARNEAINAQEEARKSNVQAANAAIRTQNHLDARQRASDSRHAALRAYGENTAKALAAQPAAPGTVEENPLKQQLAAIEARRSPVRPVVTPTQNNVYQRAVTAPQPVTVAAAQKPIATRT